MEQQVASNMENNMQVNEANAALKLKENFVKEFVADLQKASSIEHSSFEVDESPSDTSNNSLLQDEKGLRPNSENDSPLKLKKDKSDFHECGSNLSPSINSSIISKSDVPPLVGESYW